MMASFFNWFAAELFRSVLLMIGLTFCLLAVIVLLVFAIAWASDKPIFRKLFLKEESSPPASKINKVVTLEESSQPAKEAAFIFHQYEHRLQKRCPATTKTELIDWINSNLKDDGKFRFFWSEKLWWIKPPCGPVPIAAWDKSPYGDSLTQDFQDCTFYIVEIEVITASGATVRVYKPGITTQKRIIGDRFPVNGKVKRVVVERTNLYRNQAWQVEQKMLRIMAECPWSKNFQAELDWRNGCYDIDEPILSQRDCSRLGPTEWRTWRLNDDDLQKTVNLVISNTPRYSDEN
jgi:hypothetical protein